VECKVKISEGRLGRGVFARQDIPAGDIVELCPTLEVNGDDISGLLGDYVFSSNEGEDRSILLLGYGMLYNHSSDANVEHIEHGRDYVAMVAKRDIEAGDEITLDYGNDWWETREKVPD
jgi:SET domain-containing protein